MNNGFNMVNGRTAFTLLELTITMLIVGIVCMAAIPKLQQSLDQQRIDSARAQFFAELQNYRSVAMRENRRIRITPSLNTLSFAVARYNSAGTLISTETVNLASTNTPDATFDLFSAPPNAYIEFNHRGENSAPSGDVSLLSSGSVARIRFKSGGKTKIYQISASLAPLP